MLMSRRRRSLQEETSGVLSKENELWKVYLLYPVLRVMEANSGDQRAAVSERRARVRRRRGTLAPIYMGGEKDNRNGLVGIASQGGYEDARRTRRGNVVRYRGS